MPRAYFGGVTPDIVEGPRSDRSSVVNGGYDCCNVVCKINCCNDLQIHAKDLKSCVPKGPCGFDPRPGTKISQWREATTCINCRRTCPSLFMMVCAAI